jgi:hypothetical protein
VPTRREHAAAGAIAILTLLRSASVTPQTIAGDPKAVTRTQYSKAVLARDDGLRWVRKITWRVPPDLESFARRTVASCPALALLLEPTPPAPPIAPASRRRLV